MSTLLTLPLELRQNIYSFLLINRHTKGFLHGDMNFSAHTLSLTCRQLHVEALHYYYGHNVFSISFIDHSLCGFCNEPERFPSEIAANSITGRVFMHKHLKFVQNLQIKIEVLHGIYSPVQAEQPGWLCSTLRLAKRGQDDDLLLKRLQLIIRDFVTSSHSHEANWRKFTDEESAQWTALFQPLRGKVGTFMIFDQEVPFSEEGVEALEHTNGFSDDDELAGDFDI